MSLYGSIKETQKTIEKLYLNLQQRFTGNKAIREVWSKMARDVSQQIESLHELPRTFWIRLKKDQQKLLQIIREDVKPQIVVNTEDMSLSDCIASAIRSEESMILKIYAPLIRNLRANWSGLELDFYIMVKAHIVRFKRVAEAFSGDPTALQQAALLLEKFDKEVQQPQVDISRILKAARRTKKVSSKTASKPKKSSGRTAKTASKSKSEKSKKESPSPVHLSRRRQDHAKPLTEKGKLRRRRAQR